jgi:cytosine/adenosine deaminase-related metal-dependent hydrolase
MRLPDRPPFALRARVLTPLAAGGIADFVDGVIEVDDRGRISWVGDASDREADRLEAIDLRPLVVLPGMVDLHAHLPQLPNAGLG